MRCGDFYETGAALPSQPWTSVLNVGMQTNHRDCCECGSHVQVLESHHRAPADAILRVICCRCLRFAVGIDAVLLVQYAGLNPMGSRDPPRAGCPKQNIRRVLADLVDNAALTVVRCHSCGSLQPAALDARLVLRAACSEFPCRAYRWSVRRLRSHIGMAHPQKARSASSAASSVPPSRTMHTASSTRHRNASIFLHAPFSACFAEQVSRCLKPLRNSLLVAPHTNDHMPHDAFEVARLGAESTCSNSTLEQVRALAEQLNA